MTKTLIAIDVCAGAGGWAVGTRPIPAPTTPLDALSVTPAPPQRHIPPADHPPF